MPSCGLLTLKVKSFCSILVEAMDCWDVLAKSSWNSRAPTRVCFFAWRHLKARFLQRTSLKEEILVVQVDARCVWRRKNLWIISLCIVGGFLHFEICFSI